MKKNNIFIISSPLQLLNSIEAHNYFKTKNNILIIIDTNEKNNEIQISNLIPFIQWKEIIYIKLPQHNKKRALFYLDVKKALQYIKKDSIGKLFIGEYRSAHVTHIANYLNVKQIYLVDDGTAVLFYDKYIQKSFKHKIRVFIYKIFFYNLKNIEFTFYTSFNLEKKNCIKNEYLYTKSILNNKEYEDSVFFIGQPLVELGMISQENYKIEITKILKYYESKEFIYILHRRQKEKFIKELSEELGFTYKRFEQLIEIEMVLSKKLPLEFSTIYSTAILLLPKIIEKCKFKAFKIDNSLNKKSPYIKALPIYYQEFSKNKIEVLSL